MVSFFLHSGLFLLSVLIIWTMSGLLIEATENVAKRYNKPGFAVAFFVLGFLTSISEMSVAFNATIKGIPQVSAGNLVGASLVIFLFIIPLLAILNKKISLDHALRKSNLAFALMLVCLPGVLAIDGVITRWDGLLLLALYITLIYRLRKKHTLEKTIKETVRDVEKELTNKRHATLIDALHILVGALLIFFAGNILVDEAVYFTGLFNVPPSVVGLLLLSIGTNVPELIIALQAAIGKRSDIAFGDYLGSAVANVPIFGFLSLANGTFGLVSGEFILSTIVMIPGLVLFFMFGKSRNDISAREGITLIGLYAMFLVTQLAYVI